MKPVSERTLLLLLAAVNFTHIMGFMILMPLGPQLMRDLGIGPAAFSWLVSAYTLAAGAVGLAAVPFIDRYDRRTLLLATYAGFVAGTAACALAHTHATLLVARALCGAFGGVCGALVLAVVSDLVPPGRRAAGIGLVMTAFALASAVGVPLGLFLAQRFRWETPFWLLAGLSALIWLLVRRCLPPMRGHLAAGPPPPVSLRPLLALLGDANVRRAMGLMAVMVFGHFLIIPLMSPYLVANVGVAEDRLFLVYFVGGVLTVFTSPRVGRLADRRGRVRVFTVLVLTASGVTLAISHAGPLPLAAVLALAGAFFVFASGRWVPGQAIMTLAVPPERRGAFLSLNSCVRDFASGATSALGGWIVTRSPAGPLEGYGWLGWLALAANLLSLWIARRVQPVERQATGGSPA
ncbi:MAG TPA: MFS transporter [Verrucomicrobiota bacterium]|nr:MFS transporter [Verrucomicrobiota bacterium]